MYPSETKLISNGVLLWFEIEDFGAAVSRCADRLRADPLYHARSGLAKKTTRRRRIVGL